MGFAAALTVGTGALQAYGQYKSGQDKGKAEDYNASVAREAAELELEAGKYNADQTRKAGKKLTSSQEARIAANGVALSGSPLLVMEESQRNYETDAFLEEYNAKIAAKRGLSDAEYRAQLAKNYRNEGTINAATTLLSTSANTFLKYGNTGPTTTRTPTLNTRTTPSVVGNNSAAGAQAGFNRAMRR